MPVLIRVGVEFDLSHGRRSNKKRNARQNEFFRGHLDKSFRCLDSVFN
jgi:hypothetical protein